MNSLEKHVANTRSPREVIEGKTRGEIDYYLDGKGRSSIHESARNLSLNVSDDYGNRFLVELIQNAHDAHDHGRHDGRIAVVFDPTEGDFGCLYVANRGNGFSEENFLALTNIALSSKPVNESIGNKGLGFRSVLQICQWPEIYSVGPQGAQGDFDGFCFRFADRDDVADFVTGSEAQAQADEILQHMPCWYLPVFASERPGIVSRFAEERYSSVVRMPLSSSKAHELVLEQFDALLNRHHPLHLFLDRIECISLEREPGKAEILERLSQDRWWLDSGVLVERITVGGSNYLLATLALDEEIFREHLEQSISRKEVPEGWRNWQGTAQVSVAVRLGKSIETGLMYCFLPLGEEGKAPFAGYINANFYTKMDRRSVNDGVGLNKHFIDSAVKLSRQVAEFLIEQDWLDSPGTVIDLLCWDKPYAEVMQREFGGVNGELLDRPLIPTRLASGGVRWSKAREALFWSIPDESWLAAERVTRVSGAPILHEAVSESQRASLERFFLGTGVTFVPSAEKIANWVELVAKDQLSRGVPPQKWADFYDEVALYFRKYPLPLFGKRFLLSVNGELIAAESAGTIRGRRKAADVYFPPVRGDSEEEGDFQLPLEQFPVSLQQGFSLLSREIDWLSTSGGYRPARSFFLEAKLVREYNTRDVIRTLAGLTQGDTAQRTKEQALAWAFRLWSSGQSLSEKETRAAGFHVPTRGGWRRADTAMFGNGWAACSNGKRLDGFLKSAGVYSGELEAQRECLLLPVVDLPRKSAAEDDWVRFLSAAGVRDYLRPIGGQRIVKDGAPQTLAYDLARAVPELSAKAIGSWRESLSAKARSARYSQVNYRSDLVPWRMPGLCDTDGLPEDLRKEYAGQIIRSLRGLAESHLRFRIYRPGNPSCGPVPEFWPTPLMSLINETPWMPVVRGGAQLKFVRPKEAWVFDAEDEQTPRFIELVAQSVAKLIDDGTGAQLRSLFGLRTLNDERDVVQALSVYADTAVKGLTDLKDVKRFRELFDSAWSKAAPLSQGIDLTVIPVLVGNKVEAFTAEEDVTPPVIGYFVDEDDPAKRKLIEELQLPVFDFGKSCAEDTWGWLEALAPGRFVRLSEELFEVMVDGTRFDASIKAPLLSEMFGAWIIDFIVFVAEHKGGSFFKATQSTLGKIRRAAMSLRFLTGKHLQISMAGTVTDLQSSQQGAVVLWPADGAVLIAQSAEYKPDLQLLSKVAGQMALALRQAMLGSALEAALLRLSQKAIDLDSGPPDDEEIADVLGIPVTFIEQTRQYVRADLSGHVRIAGLLAAVLGVSDALELLVGLASEEDPDEESVKAALVPLASNLALSVELLIERLERVTGPSELIREFELPLAKVNKAIALSFPEFKPVSNEVAHRRQFEAFLTQNRARYADYLRSVYLSRFDEGRALDDYAVLRDQLRSIEPDPDWFETYSEVPDHVLDAHVNAWLQKEGGIDKLEASGLLPLDECCEGNRVRLRAFRNRYGKILAAWVRFGGTVVADSFRSEWADPESGQTQIVLYATKAGWLDFRLLSDSDIASRLERCGLWPVGKPLSTVLADWGMTEEVLRKSNDDIENEREKARLKSRRIKIDDMEISAVASDFHHLVAAVSQHFDDTDGLNDLDAVNRKLANPGKSSISGGGGSAGEKDKPRPIKRSPDSGLSDHQRKAIGLAGELWAKEWLRRSYSEKFGISLDDSCWVSGYSNAILGVDTGNDLLGYDLIVRLKSVTHYFEVKASIGDSGEFEMGPTEIATAYKYRADKDHRYRVLYVANATEHKRMRITVLPNPFSKEGVQKLRAVGQGSVTYKFILAGPGGSAK